MTEQSDVVVIGAGAAGALVAWSLARVGVGVTILEAGPKVDRTKATERLRRAATKLPEAPYQLAPHAGSPVTLNDTYLRQDGPDHFSSTYLRVVGGTTW